jgi:hypothetical protein
VLTAAILLATAFVAGVTGAWSPCGFSTVETLGSAAARLGGRVVRVSCATFALGALAGGAITFTALGTLGLLLGGGGEGAALGEAVAVALLAALGEALGVRVVPQIRRQVPESWRRTLPLPLAAGLYGVLLGLGFTTFVLTLAVWALAGIAVAIGSPLAGLLIGLGFGAGRALPVVALAPRYATLGERLETRMAEEPALLRRLRLADAALLAALAGVLLTSGSALAHHGIPPHAVPVARDATDPSYAGGWLALLSGGARAQLIDGDLVTVQDARRVAVGGPYVALQVGDRVTIRQLDGGADVAAADLPGLTQLAVSRRWLAWRADLPDGGERLYALSLPAPGEARVVAQVGPRERIGRPNLAGDRLAYAVSSAGGSRIVVADLAAGTERTLLRSRLTQLSQPALRDGRLLYVEAGFCDQRLLLASARRPSRPRTLLRLGTTAERDAGHQHGLTTQGREPGLCPPGTPHRTDTVLWSTALGAGVAYVTLLRPRADGRPAARIVRVPA